VKGAGEIQASTSISKVLVVPTQEEYSIARQSLEVTKILGAARGPAMSSKPTPRSGWNVKGGAGTEATSSIQLVLGAFAIAGLAVVMDRKLR